MKTQCLIVDDEPLARSLIENHIAKIESFEIVASCDNAIKAMEILQKESIDLLFLDIKMPTLTGIDFLKTLKNPPKTILTTAYRDYALESYDLDVVDYLLKPITFNRFFKAIGRYLKEITPHHFANNSRQNNPGYENFVTVRSGNKNHRIAMHEILYIESLKDYIKIHTYKKCIVPKYKISDFEKKLSKFPFLRIHRSYIINLNRITAFSSSNIEIDGIELPIGISYKEKVSSHFNNI